MADTTITLRQFLAQLAQIAEHAPDCLVRINGEYVSLLELRVQNPVAEFGQDAGYSRLGRDPHRSKVFDININGRSSDDLPRNSYLFLRGEAHA
ncbi:hypothetical protein [Companilactobacillus sp.]|uniref:hypothetical protein n=1 Tax=Companilactobacillus sp. TaxID=2767905 RepID=UPI00262DB22C|nr:hypothetical protein [Companilactobacillus sp.]